MDQIKIGMFIAELRKERGITQKQLAEEIGVSDKTISKWECGNGLPEMSSIPVLCEALDINMNELLSGERLVEEEYSRKAEENMLTLIKETEVHKKKNKTSLFLMILCIIGVGLVLLLSVCFGMASVYSTIVAFWDMFSLLMILVPTGLILVAAGRWKSFFHAFAIIGGKRGKYTIQQMREAKQALKQGANSFLTVGILESLATVILLMENYAAAMLQEHFLK